MAEWKCIACGRQDVITPGMNPPSPRDFQGADTCVHDWRRKINLGGRPRAYDSPGELQEACEDYFLENPEPTMAGLCVHLGISKDTWSSYGLGEAHEGFPTLVKAARLHVESIVEGRLLYGANVTGPLFWLKNHSDYKDSRHIGNADDQEPFRVVLDKAETNLL